LLIFELFPLFMLVAAAVVFIVLVAKHREGGNDGL
jgi:hypothetical protein